MTQAEQLVADTPVYDLFFALLDADANLADGSATVWLLKDGSTLDLSTTPPTVD